MASTATLVVSSTGHAFEIQFPELVTDHQIPVLGLRPDSTYSIQLSFTDADGNVVAAPALESATPPLPADFPTIDVLVSQPSRMEPGFTLVDRFQRRGEMGTVYSMILDATGEVVWYSTIGGGAMLQLANGHLFWRNDNNADEWTLLGDLISSIPMETPDLHHDLHPTPHGTYLSLSRETIVVDDYPTSETDPAAPPATANVRDEPAVELLPDGTEVGKWPMRDLIDTTRIGYNSLNAQPQGFDWVHNNAVFYDERDDSILVSVRHQDAVIKFSRSTGQLEWILGTHVNWKAPWQPFLLTPVGELEWQYHQHAPMVTPNGTILLFDNGNNRASPFDGLVPLEFSESYSRAVEYEVDEENMEVRQVWEYMPPMEERIYAGFISDADWMNVTGNVLVHFGGATWTGGVAHQDLGLGTRHVRIIEVTHESPGEEVFDVRIYNPPTSNIQSYRSERIPTLYRWLDADGDGMLDSVDPCPAALDDGTDTDGNGIGDFCECGDQNGDGVVNVSDLLAINAAVFDPALATPLCDTNDDDECDIQDVLGANAKIFGAPAYCARYPTP
jgi:arylsulfate sulfotransferase